MSQALPQIRVDAQAIGGGLRMRNPTTAPPGSARYSLNYEPKDTGGFRRVGGFERFDGRPAPHLAEYLALIADAGFTGLAVGDTVTQGASSGKVALLRGTLIGIADPTGPFTTGVLFKSAAPVGTITNDEPALTGFDDNELAEAAANIRRALIAKPAGTGPVLGVAVLNDDVYCWRASAGNLTTYKATPAGWVAIPLPWIIEFDGGSAEYLDGETLTQGSASAVVLRVALEGGSWDAGTARGLMAIQPVSGVFAAGIAAGGGVANLLGAATQMTQLAGGQVRHHAYSFTNEVSRRLYCCDGTNVEWEFDGEVMVPIRTGMGGLRASAVRCHKKHLVFAYGASLQLSGVGAPFSWSPVVGAAELGVGDTITNLQSVSGSEVSAALMVLCRDSAHVLYGSSFLDWTLTQISDEAGAQPGSTQEFGGVIGFDTAGARLFSPTQSFGNFSYELLTGDVEQLAAGQTVLTSVLVKSKSLVRVFMADGMFLSGAPARRGFDWMSCDYGKVIVCSTGDEIDGVHRVFMGGEDGMVYEADVGRSFDGEVVEAAIRFNRLDQRNRSMIKRYRHIELDATFESATALDVAAEFGGGEESMVAELPVGETRRSPGVGLLWDVGQWDRTYWDGGVDQHLRTAVRGKGRYIMVLLQSRSSSEMPHELTAIQVSYLAGRLVR